MNKCEKCGFMHYRTDPCRKPKPVAGSSNGRTAPFEGVNTGSSPVPASTPKPKRSGNRHRPGYFTEYMRKYRAEKKAGIR